MEQRRSPTKLLPDFGIRSDGRSINRGSDSSSRISGERRLQFDVQFFDSKVVDSVVSEISRSVGRTWSGNERLG